MLHTIILHQRQLNIILTRINTFRPAERIVHNYFLAFWTMDLSIIRRVRKVCIFPTDIVWCYSKPTCTSHTHTHTSSCEPNNSQSARQLGSQRLGSKTSNRNCLCDEVRSKFKARKNGSQLGWGPQQQSERKRSPAWSGCCVRVCDTYRLSHLKLTH